MKRVLLYSPDVIGHPRVYCRVIADALDGCDCMIVVAIGFTDQVGLAQSADLAPLVTRTGVHLIETRAWSKAGSTRLTAEELVALQKNFAIDVTLFIEADKSADEFRRIAVGAAPRLHGRNLGIFANTAEWHPGEDSFTGARKTLVAPTLRTTLGNVKRLLMDRKKSAQYFYERTILGARVLDEVLVKDERLSDWHGAPVYWMPEISRAADAPETSAEIAEFDRRKAELDAFLAANHGREPVLYFGDAAYYKGYDLFLKFVARVPSTAAIHPGRSYDAQQQGYFRCDVAALRERLKAEGRLYETNDYVHLQRLKELYFATPRVYLTTHRLALSSSTVIQALELGRPVLVPDRGLLGHRVRANGIGETYRYEDIEDLVEKAQAMWTCDLSAFSVAAKRFWQRFSDASIRDFFRARLGMQAKDGAPVG